MENIYVMKFSDFREFAEQYREEHDAETFKVIPFFRGDEAYVTVQGVSAETLRQMEARGEIIDLRDLEA